MKKTTLLLFIFIQLIAKSQNTRLLNVNEKIVLKNQNSFNFTHKYFINNCYNGIKSNKIIYQNINILHNGVDYGLSNYLSVGANVLTYIPSSFFNLHFNSQIDLNEYLKIGASYNIFFIAGNLNKENVSSKKFELLSGGITIGNLNNNLTFTIAKGHIQKLGNIGSIDENFNNLAYSLSGMAEIDKNFLFISDNFFMHEIDEKFFSLGFRKIDGNFSYDFALMGNTYKKENDAVNLNNGTKTYKDDFRVYPYLSINYLIK
jgi:hypothetical protein